MNQFKITVPASSANMGPGFDSAGLAVNRFLTLYVKKQEAWSFKHHGHFLPVITDYRDHLIYQIAKQTAERYEKTLPACQVTIESEIPLARGLGSSSSAVLAGIELANQVCDLSLSTEQKLQYGTEIEGHPDNIAPALFGGVIISTTTPGGDVEYVSLPALDLDVIVYIPIVELKTKAARDVLPDNFSRRDATTASSISNVMIASLLSGDYELAGKMMENDGFHEPFRAELIPNYEIIKQEAKIAGAYGTVISGAGPTMISFVPKGKTTEIAAHMETLLPDYEVAMLEIDQNGLQIE
ncbi:homoserine kinase [Virgibacillus halotolerans]|uniref:homoserine kinase n=1 Tax=Virgibacillus halotolerans TaxID=1071053 RepID=UPI0019609DFE|nr:homoserine kinase [Virgibacillus halotolerans]MBM7599643.1 homoserine kinase [Virgibacillus halotolerans]